ncbi:MAG: hypothetical protein LUO94_08645 [Methylococcaceae bacterium]|nr:hypothetical protein [Methylococcaceae bacterium]
MHAGFPQSTTNLIHVLRIGAGADEVLRPLLSRKGGKFLAESMAMLLKLGFGFVMRDSLLNQQQAAQARAFLEENFVIIDPEALGGKRYYQGKFLIRTRRAGDDMNVLFCFCPHPERLLKQMPWGETINSMEVVQTKVLSEQEAEELEHEPDKVDLVIRFKDVESILGLIGGANVDIVGMLLDNVVQLKGNVGHLFKLGAIGANIQQAIQPDDLKIH